MTALPSVRTGLLRDQLDDQAIVYDPRDDRVHLLDSTTATVLALLEQPGQTTQGIIAELSQGAGEVDSEALMALAIEELRKAELGSRAQRQGSVFWACFATTSFEPTSA